MIPTRHIRGDFASHRDGGRPIGIAFEDDPVVPRHSPIPWTPEHTLIAAILEDALVAIRGTSKIAPPGPDDDGRRQHRRSDEKRRLEWQRRYDERMRDLGRRTARDVAREWFASDDLTWPFSFVNICHHLGLSASAIRAQLAHEAAGGVGPAPLGPRSRGGQGHFRVGGKPAQERAGSIWNVRHVVPGRP